MEEIDERFFTQHGLQFVAMIAKGGYGIVYKVYSFQYKQDFALKRVPADRFVQSEVECMKKVESPFIVSLYNYYFFEKYVYLLMEFCPKSLYQLINSRPQVPLPELIRNTHGVLVAVKACHDNKIAHSDIKPTNFLVDNYGRIKVADFGLSAVYDEGNKNSSSFKGSNMFMAPEIFKKIPFNPFKADIWALGVTFFFMATQTFPFDATNLRELISQISCGEWNSNYIQNDAYRLMVTKCLNDDPNKRPTIDDLLQDPIFTIGIQFQNSSAGMSQKAPKSFSMNQLRIKPVSSSLLPKKHIKRSTNPIVPSSNTHSQLPKLIKR